MKKHSYYYSSNAPEVVAAVKKMFKERTAFLKKCEAFASKFADLKNIQVYYSEMGGLHFRGFQWIKGNKPLNPEQWSKKDKHGMQFPKTTGAESAALRKLWNDNVPKEYIKGDEWYELIGHKSDWMSGCPGVVLKKGVVYIHTDSPLTKNVTEIFTSTYVKALGKQS